MKPTGLVSRRSATLALLLLAAIYTQSRAQGVSALRNDLPASRTSRHDSWLHTLSPGLVVMQRELKLKPQAEPKPALSVVLIPNEFYTLDGNAAVQYLQAISFSEQRAAREAMDEFQRSNRQALEEAGKDVSLAEPYVWLETPPAELPIERVKKYLHYSSWQQRHLEQAARQRTCDFDRNIREVENLAGFLLPEIQELRNLARLQSMRFRLALAEDRPADAVAILGQQLALGHHLENDHFLVSNLVGIACAGIGWQDAMYLTEHSSAPNLYWALASLPQPLISMRGSLAYEREFLFEQFKDLRDIDETPRTSAYWKEFIERLAPELAALGFPNLGPSESMPAALVGLLGAAYPGARLFLIEEMGMEPAKVDALPVAQAVLLAVRRLHERLRDDVFKYQYLPVPLLTDQDPYESLEAARRNYGWITALSDLFLPTIQAAFAANTRLQQQLALLQTIESIRDYMAANDGRLPKQLSNLRLPAPYDPVTFKPFEYRLEQNGHGRLSGAKVSNVKYEFILAP